MQETKMNIFVGFWLNFMGAKIPYPSFCSKSKLIRHLHDKYPFITVQAAA
jgi:hypothetical protein